MASLHLSTPPVPLSWLSLVTLKIWLQKAGRHKQVAEVYFLLVLVKQLMQVHYRAYYLCFPSLSLVMWLFALFLSQVAIEATECHAPTEAAEALISLILGLHLLFVFSCPTDFSSELIHL